MGKCRSQDATTFWILKSDSFIAKPSFRIYLAYILEEVLEISSDFAPVQTTFPDLKMRAVVFGSLIRIIHAANLLGLYSEFLARKAIYLRSSSQPRLKVETMFYSLGLYLSSGSGTTFCMLIWLPFSTILCSYGDF